MIQKRTVTFGTLFRTRRFIRVEWAITGVVIVMRRG